MRGRGQKDRHVQLVRQPLQAGNMVGVLVGNQDRGNFFGPFAERRQPLESLAPRKTGIHQNAG